MVVGVPFAVGFVVYTEFAYRYTWRNQIPLSRPSHYRACPRPGKSWRRLSSLLANIRSYL